MNTIDKKELQKMMTAGYVVCQTSPWDDYKIYNYTKQCQYDRAWNKITLQCRGLILDSNFNIIARPFPKFFNMEELPPVDVEKRLQTEYEVFKKMDGSCGIMYYSEALKKHRIASRGSFNSEQAIEANKILDEMMEKDPTLNDRLKSHYTHMFEIIYPNNRIIVNYGDKRELVLLGAVGIMTGVEASIDSDYIKSLGFEIVESYKGNKDFEYLKSLNTDNEEGWVIKFSDDFRMKIKYAEYCRIHALVSGVSTKAVWNCLKNGDNFNKYMSEVPEEFYTWIRARAFEYNLEYKRIEIEILEMFNNYVSEFSYPSENNKKHFALWVQDNLPKKDHGVIFNLANGLDYSKFIWDRIRPIFRKAFNDEE